MGAVPAAERLVHHSDRGAQYLSIRYTERLAEAGIEPSVGSVGDSYDNALAETIIGLFKTEVIRRRGPWRDLEDVEFATLEWVAGSTTGGCSSRSATCRRPSSRSAIIATNRASPWWRDSTNRSPGNPGRFTVAYPHEVGCEIFGKARPGGDQLLSPATVPGDLLWRCTVAAVAGKLNRCQKLENMSLAPW